MILFVCLLAVPHWSGISGAIAMCGGVMGELVIVLLLLFKYRKMNSAYI